MIGIKCRVIRFISEIFILDIGADIFILDPWLVDEYRYREYATVTNLIILNGITTIIDCFIIAIINIISLIRLILGGAAILAHENINHHIEIFGIIDIIPLVSRILRVDVIL